MMTTNYYQTSKSSDNAKFDAVPWDSALINGKGRYYDQKTGINLKFSSVMGFDQINGNYASFWMFYRCNLIDFEFLPVASIDKKNISSISLSVFLLVFYRPNGNRKHFDL